MSNYDDANRHRRKAFILKYQDKDFSNGGKLNLCDLNILKSLWREMFPDQPEFPLISLVQYHFRDAHILYLYTLKAEGFAPYDLLDKGFSAKIINKYWDNRELAERIVGFKLP